MEVLSLTATEEVDAPPAVVFALFGAGTGAGWVFDAVCDPGYGGPGLHIDHPLVVVVGQLDAELGVDLGLVARVGVVQELDHVAELGDDRLDVLPAEPTF